MDPALVADIIETVGQTWVSANDIEVTLEANPSSVESARFMDFRHAGVNRVSIGVQALNDEDLQRLGRVHSVKEAISAIEIAQTHFDRSSFDLIYARQHQDLESWSGELKRAISMSAGHLSLYQLTVEQGTAFGDRYTAGKLKGLPDDDLSADLFEATQDICDAAGFSAYEVSNHARPGYESLHNLIYWRYGDYVGIGPGAHGRITVAAQKTATEATKAPGDWLHKIENGTCPETSTVLSKPEQAAEYLIMGLRIAQGVDLKRYEALAGEALNASAVQQLSDLGFIIVEAGRVSTTRQGRPILNQIISTLAS